MSWAPLDSNGPGDTLDGEPEEEGEIDDREPPIPQKQRPRSPIHGMAGYGSILNDINPKQQQQHHHPPAPEVGGPGIHRQRTPSWGPRTPGRGMASSSFNPRPPQGRGMPNRHNTFGGSAGAPPSPAPIAQRSQSLTAYGGGNNSSNNPRMPPSRPTDPRFRVANANAHGNKGQNNINSESIDRRPSNESAGLKPPPPPPHPPTAHQPFDQHQPQPQERRGLLFEPQQKPNDVGRGSSYSSLAEAEQQISGGIPPREVDAAGVLPEAQSFRRPSHEYSTFGHNAHESAGSENMRSSEGEEFGFRGDGNAERDEFRRSDPAFNRSREGEEFRPGFRGSGGPDLAGGGRGQPCGDGFRRDGPFGRRRGSDFRVEGSGPSTMPFNRGGRGGRGPIPSRGHPPSGPGRGRGELPAPLQTESYYGPPNQEFRRSPPARGRFGGRGGRGGPGRGGPFSAPRNNSGSWNNDRFGSLSEYGAEASRSFDGGSEEVGSKSSFAAMADRPSFSQDRSSFRSSQGSISGLSPDDKAPDPFGRTRDWSAGRSPQSSPVNRKKMASIALGEDATAPESIKSDGLAFGSAETGGSPRSHAAVEKEAPPPSPLRTNALGDQSMQRAEHAIKMIHDNAIDSSLKQPNNGQPSELPTKQVLFKAMALLDQRLKQTQDLLAKKSEHLEIESKREADEKKMAEEEAIAEAKQKEFDRLARIRDREEAEKRTRELELSELKEAGRIKLGEKRDNEMETLQAEIVTKRNAVIESMSNEVDLQLVAASKSFDKDLEVSRKSLDRLRQAASKTEAKLAGFESEMKGKLAKAKESSNVKAVEVSDVVQRVLEDNRRKAAEAHVTCFATSEERIGPDARSDLESRLDPKEGKTNAEWSELTQQVTGLGDSLYSQPSDAPYFKFNEELHKEMGPLVTEYVRSGKEQMEKEWIELAEEYEYRANVFQKKWKKRSSQSRSRSSRPPISTLVPRQAVVPMLESGGGRPPTQTSSSNPYRRARRGNEVRTEYEQEQIMAEIAEKEAMEKKIVFGGSALPRQEGYLEKRFTASFRQTFHSHRFDPLEVEADLAITNVWTDMEKCIFLDRFMHHPKDFRKIASFLRNKTTVDCVAFYYDSKQTVPYKGALKEFIMRRKRRGEYHVWDATIQAALSVGAVIKEGPSEDKPLLFLLPAHENSYVTSNLHPMKFALFEDLQLSKTAGGTKDEPTAPRSRKRPSLFVLDRKETKHLKIPPSEKPALSTTDAAPSVKERPKKALQESIEDADHSSKTAAASKDAAGTRRAPQKWTAAEKRVFLETLEKHGRDWELLSRAVGTKSTAQIKNYYYDHKKQLERNKKEGKKVKTEKKRKDGRATPPPPTGVSRKSETSSDTAQPDKATDSVPAAAVHQQESEPAGSYADAQMHGSAVQRASTIGKMEEDHERGAEAMPDVWQQAHNAQQNLMESQLQQLQQAPSHQLQQQEVVARLLRQQQQQQPQPQSQHHQLLSGFLPNVVHSRQGGDQHAGPVSELEQQQQQLQALIQLQQQQQQQQQQLQSLNLSNYGTSMGLLERQQQHHQQQQQQQQHRHQQQQQQRQVDDHLVAFQQLLGGRAGLGESSLSNNARLALLAQALQQQQNPNQQDNTHNGHGPM